MTKDNCVKNATEFSFNKDINIQNIIECKDLPKRENMLTCSVCREGKEIKQIELGRKVHNHTMTTSFRLCQGCRLSLIGVLK